MNKLFLFIFLFISEIAFSQKVVVGVNKINTLYYGMKNSLDIAVDGYTRDQLNINAFGCKLEKDTIQNQLYLTPTYPNLCKISVSYKKGKLLKTDTIRFKTEHLNHPITQYGKFNSGTSLRINELMNQNSINVVVPNSPFEEVEFRVVSFYALYVPASGEAKSFNVLGNTIPLGIKYQIMAAKSGDKILIDNILAEGSGGIKRRVAPIVIDIKDDFKNINELFETFNTYQTEEDTINKKFDKNNSLYDFGAGITYGYIITCCDQIKSFEVQIKANKIIYEKQYYRSGKLKASYNFEENDTVGDATCYYENGNVKSNGKVIAPTDNIYTRYRDFNMVFSGVEMSYGYNFKDSFLIHNYAPVGHWLCYSEKGKLLIDCNLSLFDYRKIPMKDGDAEFDLSMANKNRRLSSIKEALKNKDNYYKADFNGPLKSFDKQGKLLNETFYNYQPDWYCKLIVMNDYYENGNIKEEYYFGDNDTTGHAKTFYENGKLKSEGSVISQKINVDEIFHYPDSLGFTDTFCTPGFTKIGKWKGYYAKGQLAIDYNLKLFGWTDLQKHSYDNTESKGFVSIAEALLLNEEKIKIREYSIFDAKSQYKNKFSSLISGPCRIYNEQGKLIKEIDFKN